MENKPNVKQWGEKIIDGAEIWDTEPIFKSGEITWKDWLKLFCFPKKFLLFNWLRKNKPENILDVGCGTGAEMIEMKKIFGRGVEIIGTDIVKLQVDLANQKIKKNGVWAEAFWFDGKTLPFENSVFEAVYTSNVLEYVSDVPAWLDEINRVLKSGGALAMFAESKYSKDELKNLLARTGFEIKKMYNIFWLNFFIQLFLAGRLAKSQGYIILGRKL